MKQSYRSPWSIKNIFTLLSILSFGLITVTAAPPPVGGYLPNATLSPSCAPGAADCVVADVLNNVAIGDTILNGDPNSILFLDNAGDLAQSANFTYQDNILFESLMTGAVNNSDIAFRQFSDDLGNTFESPTAPAEGFAFDIENPEFFSGFSMVHGDVSDFAALPPGSAFGSSTNLFVGNALGIEELVGGLRMFALPQVFGGGTVASFYAENVTTGFTSDIEVSTSLVDGNVINLRNDDGVNSQELSLNGVNVFAYLVDGVTIWRMPTTQGSAGQALVLDVDNETLIWEQFPDSTIYPITGGNGSSSYFTDNTTDPGETFNVLFFGDSAGEEAVGASNSNFLGAGAGFQAAGVTESNFIGLNAGSGATNASQSNFFGHDTGAFAIDATGSNFFGDTAGLLATNASNSNFFGQSAGSNATNAFTSNFFGNSAGFGATNASGSNFFGQNAGQFATDASNSNFFGQNAGGATNANNSNFFGQNAGSGATNASDSNFLGSSAGLNAVNTSNSNFFGNGAGANAINATDSFFVGNSAGSGATNASKSIFLGVGAGLNDTVDNTVNANDYSILIGPNSSTGGFSNSIALGRFATNTATNQFLIGSATTPINQTRIIGSAATECTITTGTGIACSSDETIKSNITDLESNILDTLTQVRTVTYNWTQDSTSPEQIGFLAQDLEQFFPQLVTTNESGMKSVYYSQMTPVLVQAIRELDMKIDSLFVDEGGFLTQLRTWLGSAENNLEQIFARRFVAQDEICIGQTCINEAELQELLDLRMQSDEFIYHSVPDTDNSSAESVSDQESLSEEEPAIPADDTQTEGLADSEEEEHSSENENEITEPTPVEEEEIAEAPTEEPALQESGQ